MLELFNSFLRRPPGKQKQPEKSVERDPLDLISPSLSMDLEILENTCKSQQFESYQDKQLFMRKQLKGLGLITGFNDSTYFFQKRNYI